MRHGALSLKIEREAAIGKAGIESEVRVLRAAIGNMIKSIAGVECGLIGQEIGEPESCHQDKVELAGLLRDLSGEIGPEGASGEFGIGSDPIQCDEGIFDFRGEADAVRDEWFLELDIDHLGADRNLTLIPAVADRIAQRHHPGGHKGNSLLLRSVVLCETMRQEISYREADFLCPYRDLRCGVCGVNRGGQCSHEHDQENIDEQFPNLLRSLCQYPVGYREVRLDGQV
jgi:hypothetical protein